MILANSPTEQRIRKLQSHLANENPVLLQVVKSFRTLDRVAYALGLLDHEESYATKVPWWPMISVLGTFSSGKSTFINRYLGRRLQTTGNQAVDDRFTVICFSSDGADRTLPGRALDADPRFPFYQMSRDIESVAEGEGSRIDAYLQLKTSASEKLRGKILIDSPGFDADEQRNSTLRVTDHIIDLSDLVLVFFDARHPEPGAMQDTLQHLVADTIGRPDSSKFLFILNQIDNAAREDNPEEVFAAWQRAVAQKGLTAGRFYTIYDPDAAIPIDDPKLRQRFESKRDADTAAITERLDQVEVERAYRIIGVLEHTAKTIEERIVPALAEARRRWKRRVVWMDTACFGALLVGALAWTVNSGYWQGLSFQPPWLEGLLTDRPVLAVVLGTVAVLGGYLHFALRRLAARTVTAGLRRDPGLADIREPVMRGFRKNTRPWRSFVAPRPVGWGRTARRRIERVLAEADRYVQTLNSSFTDPSGDQTRRRRRRAKPAIPTPKSEPAAAVKPTLAVASPPAAAGGAPEAPRPPATQAGER